MSEYQEDDFITLTDEDGKDTNFLLLDVVEYEGDDYMVMMPADDEEAENDDEEDGVLILKVVHEAEEDVYVGVEDESILDAVFNIFQEQCNEETEEDED
jgi:uncharacterized protein YrzB (UPF0473 family)